jgi:hypothetical protein
MELYCLDTITLCNITLCKRCMGRATQPDRTRLLGYLINTLGRIVSLYNYQGRNAEGLKSCRDYLTQLIQ